MQREVDVHFLPARFPRALDGRLHLLSKGCFPELEDEIVTVCNQQAPHDVMRNRTDCSEPAHTVTEEDRQGRGAVERFRLEPGLFLTASQRRELDLAMQLATASR